MTRFNTGLVFLLMIISATILFFNQAQASQDYGIQKVVYHINYDDAQKQAATLKNIQNHLNAVGSDKLQVKVVLHCREEILHCVQDDRFS